MQNCKQIKGKVPLKMEATFYLGKEGVGVVSELPTSNNYLDIDWSDIENIEIRYANVWKSKTSKVMWLPTDHTSPEIRGWQNFGGDASEEQKISNFGVL